MKFKKLFFSFEGCIGRLQWWIGGAAATLFSYVFTLTFAVILDLVLELMFGIQNSDVAAQFRFRIVAFVVDVIFMYPWAALAVKRLHDRNQPGKYVWLLLAANAIGIVERVFGFGGFDHPAHASFESWIMTTIIGVIGLAFVIELGFRRGVVGPTSRASKIHSGATLDEAR